VAVVGVDGEIVGPWNTNIFATNVTHVFMPKKKDKDIYLYIYETKTNKQKQIQFKSFDYIRDIRSV
jgi:hypothetical protein